MNRRDRRRRQCSRTHCVCRVDRDPPECRALKNSVFGEYCCVSADIKTVPAERQQQRTKHCQKNAMARHHVEPIVIEPNPSGTDVGRSHKSRDATGHMNDRRASKIHVAGADQLADVAAGGQQAVSPDQPLDNRIDKRGHQKAEQNVGRKPDPAGDRPRNNG